MMDLDEKPSLALIGPMEPSRKRAKAATQRGDAQSPQRPTRGRPSKIQIERRNQELLDQALVLFLERGFEGTTIEAIVESLGMARKTVYSRYGDKLTLFKAALERAVERLVVPTRTLVELHVDDLHDTLVAIAKTVLNSIRSDLGEQIMRLAQAELYKMPEIWDDFFTRTAQITIDHLACLFEARLRVTDGKDSALSFYLLVIHGSYLAQTWTETSLAEFDRQLIFRTRLFLDGAASASSAVPRG